MQKRRPRDDEPTGDTPKKKRVAPTATGGAATGSAARGPPIPADPKNPADFARSAAILSLSLSGRPDRVPEDVAEMQQAIDTMGAWITDAYNRVDDEPGWEVSAARLAERIGVLFFYFYYEFIYIPVHNRSPATLLLHLQH